MLVRLPDGTRVLIRRIRPQDKGLLAAALSRLSVESRHRRFLSPKTTLSPSELRYLTEVDGNRHVAFVALLADHPDRLVAVGRFVRLSEDPETAEVAIVVGDELQGLGLGRRLGLLLADEARALGVRRFCATMLSDNAPAHRLLARIARQLSSGPAGPVHELVGDLAA